MDEEQKLTAQLNVLFHPESVAVIGVPRGMKSGKLFLLALLDQGFPGKIYPVHPQATEIEGLKAYPKVSAIPDSVDLAIVLVPNHEALPVIRDCARKGVKGAVLFTAGYKETGTAEGKALEEALVRVAHTSGMRLIGPNCMGIYSPKSGLSFFPQSLSGTRACGDYLSQWITRKYPRKNRFSKGNLFQQGRQYRKRIRSHELRLPDLSQERF